MRRSAAARATRCSTRRRRCASPAHPLPLPAAATLRVRGLRARYGGRLGARRRRPRPRARPPGRRRRAAAARASRRSPPCCCASWTTRARSRSAASSSTRSTATPCRTVVGLVAQDAHVFDTTLRENLLLARRDASEAELRAALARARLLAWTATLPAGLETEARPGGRRLSGGQRRRIALARAELARFPLLVLDEPGEHLDVETADAIVADALASDRGTLLITHRLAGPGGDGRDRRARGRPRRRARHPRRAAAPRRPLRGVLGARGSDARAEHAVGPALVEQHERDEHGGGDGHHLQRVGARGGAGRR